MIKRSLILSALKNETLVGFIIAAARQSQRIEKHEPFEELIDLGIPLVMFDSVIDELECDKIVNDHYQSGRRALECLLESGNRIICIALVLQVYQV
ncbi:hypothetical protein CW736_10425 [Nonlabens sp. MB-3u-79]|uniref:LacI family transcriptional regulator n=1 Tax=Nonlabens sp. MB-3u-79 TaxID=2058134 RepID=UPI000C3171F8|nr:LacI family transcriptional regulator [Nonlabens sp. MB-3u-79]AUC79748.1 hypothetical protein CW736_10425 [Nonlabens sp. MB-3u-79]